MSMVWEDYVKDCTIEVLTAEEADEELQPNELPDATHVLVLGSGGGGGFATGGSLDELAAFAMRIAEAVAKART